MADSSSQISGVVGTDGVDEYGVENVGVIVPVVGVGSVSVYGVDETVPVDGGVVNRVDGGPDVSVEGGMVVERVVENRGVVEPTGVLAVVGIVAVEAVVVGAQFSSSVRSPKPQS